MAAIYIIICLILLAAIYIFAITPRLTKRKESARFRHTMFAHRGCHCLEKLIPENSMAAFKAAIAHGCGIELDIHLTKDGKLAVFHDDKLDRVCHVSGSIESYTFEELEQFHLFNTSEKIPLFENVLSTVNGRVPLLVELKIPGHSLKICEEAYRLLKDYKGDFLVQSFNTLGIRWFRLHAPLFIRGQLSSDLVTENFKENILLRFCVKHLLCNVLGRPDFISYKLNDLPDLSVTLCQKLFRIPIAVWTLRTEKALEKGRAEYDMQIFEKKGGND